VRRDDLDDARRLLVGVTNALLISAVFYAIAAWLLLA